MNKTKGHNGITLIALIVSIIVMIILVGVTVTLAINGNLFNFTKRAAIGYDVEHEREQIRLCAYSAQMDGTYGIIDENEFSKELAGSFGNNNFTLTKVDNDFKITIKKSGRTYRLDEDGELYLLENDVIEPRLTIARNTGKEIIAEVTGEGKENFTFQFSTDGENWTNAENNKYTVAANGKKATYTIPENGFDDIQEPQITGESENVTIYLKSTNKSDGTEKTSSLSVEAATIAEGGNENFFTYEDLGDEIAITGYSNQAFNQSIEHSIFLRGNYTGDQKQWKILIPSFINNKPVTKISKEFIEQNLTKSALVFGENETFNTFVSSYKYSNDDKSSKGTSMDYYTFAFNNGEYNYVGLTSRKTVKVKL